MESSEDLSTPDVLKNRNIGGYKALLKELYFVPEGENELAVLENSSLLYEWETAAIGRENLQRFNSIFNTGDNDRLQKAIQTIDERMLLLDPRLQEVLQLRYNFKKPQAKISTLDEIGMQMTKLTPGRIELNGEHIGGTRARQILYRAKRTLKYMLIDESVLNRDRRHNFREVELKSRYINL